MGALPFTNDFEEGDYTGWTSTSGTPTIVHDPVHHNLHASSCNANTEYASRTYDAAHIVFSRCYVRVDAVPDHNADTAYFIHNCKIGTSNCHYLGLTMEGGVVKWMMRYLSAGAALTDASDEQTGAVANQWYCIEIQTHLSSADGQLDGEYHAYVGGVELSDIAKLNIDTDITQLTGIRVGVEQLGGTYAPTAVADCVKADTAGPIGLEATGPTVKKGSNLANTMTTMLNSKMLFSACNRFPKLAPRRF